MSNSVTTMVITSDTVLQKQHCVLGLEKRKNNENNPNTQFPFPSLSVLASYEPGKKDGVED